MSKRTKWGVGGGIVLAIVLVGVLSAAKGRNKATEVRIENVEKRDLVASVTASGQVQPRRKVDVSADITGRIVRLAVREGDRVTKGQFLLEIDPSNYIAESERSAAAVASSQANLRQARTSLAQARRNYERMAELKRANPTLISDEQVEQLRTQVEVSEASAQASSHAVAQAAAALRDARSRLAKTTIVAPMTGRVTRLNIEEGETAVVGTMNNPGSLLLTVADLGEMEASVKVDETDVPHISHGDSASVKIDAFPDQTFTGRVTQIANSAIQGQGTAAAAQQNQSVDFEVVITLDNPPAELRPDLSATAEIITETRDRAISVPIIAVTVRDPDGKKFQAAEAEQGAPGGLAAAPAAREAEVEGVFVLSDGTAAWLPITLGIAGDQYFEVVEGLKGGEVVIAGPYSAVRDLEAGSSVRTPEVARPEAADSASTKEET